MIFSCLLLSAHVMKYVVTDKTQFLKDMRLFTRVEWSDIRTNAMERAFSMTSFCRKRKRKKGALPLIHMLLQNEESKIEAETSQM